MGNIDWVQFLTDPVTLASVLACVATFATVLTLAGPAFDNGKLTNRLKSVSNRREELRKKSRAALAHAMGITAHQALLFSIKNLGLTRLEKTGPDWRVAAVNEEPWTLPG